MFPGRDPEGGRHEVRQEPVVAYRLAATQEVVEAMQVALVRVARPEYQEDRVEPRGGREVAPPRQVDADSVADDRADHRPDGGAMSRTLRVPIVSTRTSVWNTTSKHAWGEVFGTVA